MKISKIVIVLSSLLLVSCNNATSSSGDYEESAHSSILDSENSKEDDVPTSSDSEDSKENESSSKEEKIHTLSPTDFPKNVAGKYPEDTEIETSSGDKYFISLAMQGEGSYEGYIQMKKNDSFFYSKFAYTGLISFDVMIKRDYTGIPSLYYGNEENSSSNTVELTKESNQDGMTYHYSGNVDGFFALKDESPYALYLKNFMFN